MKTKLLLRDKVWFPKMDILSETTVKKCVECQIATALKPREPLCMTELLPKAPWQEISMDFAEIGTKYALIIVDDYSRYPVVEIVHSTSAKVVIPKLDKVFAMFCIPTVVKTDNGPPFNRS